MGYKIAVMGATGNIGREVLSILAERQFPIDKAVALASPRSKGKQISLGENKTLTVESLPDFDFHEIDIVFSSPGATVSKEFVPKAAEAGAVVIDNTSQFRMDPDVPLIVPEINPKMLQHFHNRRIIANPNCSTIQMVMALKPLHDLATISRVVVSTYQSVSGAGKSAMDELFDQTRGIYVNQAPEKACFTKQIAFNAIPHIDSFMEDGSTREEWKMQVETRKILDPDIKVVAHCVRVPVFVGHGEAVSVEFNSPVSVEKARAALKAFPGVAVIDMRTDEGYVTPLEVAGEDLVFVSRIRQDPTVKHGLLFWVVGDNLRKGAALNTVQIAEQMISDGLI